MVLTICKRVGPRVFHF